MAEVFRKPYDLSTEKRPIWCLS